MTTDQISEALELTSKLMELHGENPFKVKALAGAAYRIGKSGMDLEGKSREELELVEGIGKSIAAKIDELQSTGTIKELAAMMAKTPSGVIEMLDIKGIGPKKVGQLWKELGLESPGELMYACKENRLIELKGFGQKTQASIIQSIEFAMANRGKFYYATVEKYAHALVEFLEKQTGAKVSLTGDVRRKSLVIVKMEVLVAAENVSLDGFDNPLQIPVEVITCSDEEFYAALFRTTASESHLKQLESCNVTIKANAKSEEEIYAEGKMAYIEPELREGNGEIMLAQHNKLPKLIEVTDLKGILHCHSKWSDGLNTLEDMAKRCKEMGYEYFGICDHSKTAGYAGGLKEDRVLAQQKEVDELNKKLGPGFKIFKGIESDILVSGALDYEEDILKTFDFIVASVHSVLKMDKEKATQRLLTAIENPYTRILGHPTGRLLLSREGYPLDHKKIIDACAANNVVIELNAHPYRLDIDWTWIPYCLEKNVMISINPDSHEKEAMADVKWGTFAARKGMLTKEFCLNAKSLTEFEEWLASK